MGQVSVLENRTPHVDVGEGIQASIKGKVSNPEKGAGKNDQKPEPPSPPPGERLPGRTQFKLCMNTTKNPLSVD